MSQPWENSTGNGIGHSKMCPLRNPAEQRHDGLIPERLQVWSTCMYLVRRWQDCLTNALPGSGGENISPVPPTPPLSGRVFHTSLSGVCRRRGRLLGRCCSLPALSGTENYIFPQVRLTRLEGGCICPRSAVSSCGMETALHTYHCSFLIGDWFPSECVCMHVCLSKTSNTLIAGFLIALYENTHSLQAFI